MNNEMEKNETVILPTDLMPRHLPFLLTEIIRFDNRHVLTGEISSFFLNFFFCCTLPRV